MQNLTFVGLSDDGAALILSSGDGSRFRLPIDERLRSATRAAGPTWMCPTPRHRPRHPGQTTGRGDPEVAEFSGWNVDRVEAFAAPVLQERGWIAEKAQACPVGRGEEDPTLGDVVVRRLVERGIDEDSIRWDSWRRDDGPVDGPAGLSRRQRETAWRPGHSTRRPVRWPLRTTRPAGSSSRAARGQPAPAHRGQRRRATPRAPCVCREPSGGPPSEPCAGPGAGDDAPAVSQPAPHPDPPPTGAARRRRRGSPLGRSVVRLAPRRTLTSALNRPGRSGARPSPPHSGRRADRSAPRPLRPGSAPPDAPCPPPPR